VLGGVMRGAVPFGAGAEPVHGAQPVLVAQPVPQPVLVPQPIPQAG
jgi:hypothetical protein